MLYISDFEKGVRQPRSLQSSRPPAITDANSFFSARLDHAALRTVRAALLYAVVIRLERFIMPTRPAAVLSVRVSASERALLEAAAEQSRTNLSDFVRRRALEAAESDLLERRIVTIPAKDWARFENWASAPAKDVPALRKLSKSRPVWQK